MTKLIIDFSCDTRAKPMVGGLGVATTPCPRGLVRCLVFNLILIVKFCGVFFVKYISILISNQKIKTRNV